MFQALPYAESVILANFSKVKSIGPISPIGLIGPIRFVMVFIRRIDQSELIQYPFVKKLFF